MTQEEILQYNKRCAEFLGFKYHEGSEYWTTMLWGGAGFTLRKMKFDSDWNWIMAVVEAIENRTAYVNIKGCAVDISTIANTSAPSKKESVVEAINQFLIWYEQNKII